MKDINTIKEEHERRGQSVAKVVKEAICEKQIVDADINPSIDLFNLSMFKERILEMSSSFSGDHFNHALAVKSNPVRGVLNVAKELGFGAECASFPEAKHALSLGFEPRKVVYDSPCKTNPEIKELMLAGCYINLDNETEIEKINKLLLETNYKDFDSQIGLRINPVVGGGNIASTSTATATSKFGLPLTPKTSDQLISLYQNNPWLQGVHVHVGSQGCALSMLVEGSKRALNFAEAVNEKIGSQQIKVIDIGGGMPTLYDGLNEAFTFKEYSEALKKSVPELLNGKYKIITEFGRSVMVKPGITISRIEAVKEFEIEKADGNSDGDDIHRIAVTHVGANQFLRTAYLPHQWKHEMTLFSSEGAVKGSSEFSISDNDRTAGKKAKSDSGFLKYDIAGPLCFSGDFLAKGIYLPKIENGDYLVIHDTGGYTTAMYSKYNSRCASAMYAYESEDGSDSPKTKFFILKKRETTEETLAFWGENEMKEA